jgi:hypothetical protein
LGSVLQLSLLRRRRSVIFYTFAFVSVLVGKRLKRAFYWYPIYLQKGLCDFAVMFLRFLGSVLQLSPLRPRLSVTFYTFAFVSFSVGKGLKLAFHWYPHSPPEGFI